MSLWVVVGGQFGSEGKGKVSAFITKQENIDICIRCGGPNSGHSFVDENGRTIILRQLPTGYVRSKTRLLIPAGALIDLDVLRNEIQALNIPPERIGVDPNCFIIDATDRDAEHTLKLQERLSSTLCGVGSAVSRRVLRSADAKLVKDVADQHPWLKELLVEDGVSAELNASLDQGKKALIEGTQGFGLSLYHSGFYPHCTSRDTTAAGFLSEVGVSPLRVTEIVVVFRTFPIRVAGQQAGPLKDEIDWDTVRRESGYRHDIEERTSVTNRVRRVARFDWESAEAAVRVNCPTSLAVNGVDYLSFGDRGKRSLEELSPMSKAFINRMGRTFLAPVRYVGAGPELGNVFTTPELSPIEDLLPRSIGSYSV
jgi:adenylosuccinate synthase